MFKKKFILNQCTYRVENYDDTSGKYIVYNTNAKSFHYLPKDLVEHLVKEFEKGA